MAEKIGAVDEFLTTLEPQQRTQVVDLRRIILAARPELVEHIKWNSPSYVHGGIDRMTINVRNKQNAVQLILHMGTVRLEDRKAPPIMTDETGLVRWLSDVRGVIRMMPGEAVNDMHADLTTVICHWLDAS